MYFGSLGTRLTDVIQTGFTQATQIVPSNNGGVTFDATLANPFPNGIIRPLGAAGGPGSNAGNSVNFFNPHPKAARLHKYQLDIQREFRGHMVLDVGYQGARNLDGEVSRALTALPNQYLSTSPARDQNVINNLTANLPNPFFGISQFNGTGLAGSVIARSSLLAPYPQFASVGYFTYDGKSWYDAFYAKIEKRFSHGFTAEANYTFSKFIEATTLLNPGDASPSKVISDQDFPHHVILSGIWELPLGRGRKFLSNVHSVADVLLSGWQFSPIYTYQSGPPVGFGNVILNGNIHDVPLSKNDRSVYRWFNTSLVYDLFAVNQSRRLLAFSSRRNANSAGEKDRDSTRASLPASLRGRG